MLVADAMARRASHDDAKHARFSLLPPGATMPPARSASAGAARQTAHINLH